jgi:hypothetical protein
VRRADNLTTFMCHLSRNLEASTSWNPYGLSGLYLLVTLRNPKYFSFLQDART